MGLLLSQGQLPIFASTADLTAYAPDGLTPGFLAATSSPFALWMYSTAAPAGGVSSITGTGGYWLRYNGLLIGAGNAWLPVSGAFTIAAGSNYDVDVTAGVASATLPAAPGDGEVHAFKVNGAATHNFTLTRGGASPTIEQLDGTFATTFVFGVNNQELGWVYDLANTKWRLL